MLPEHAVGGSVTFLNNTVCSICESGFQFSTIGSAPVVNGVATLNASLVASPYLISALYVGDDLYRGAQSGRTPLSVLTVPAAPAVTGNPSDQSVSYGSACQFSNGVIIGCAPNVTFSASASGNPAPTVQWQVKTPGGSFVNIGGATSSQYDFFGQVSQSGNKYRAVFTNNGGSATTTKPPSRFRKRP